MISLQESQPPPIVSTPVSCMQLKRTHTCQKYQLWQFAQMLHTKHSTDLYKTALQVFIKNRGQRLCVCVCVCIETEFLVVHNMPLNSDLLLNTELELQSPALQD